MKLRLFCLTLLLTLGTVSRAQRYDNIWMLSGQLNADECWLNFVQSPPIGQLQELNMNFFLTDASICDSSGNLLFYTNGQIINNRFHKEMWNSNNYNPGWASNKYYVIISGTDTTYGGLGLGQSCLILPSPLDSNQYYLFHVSADSFFSQEFNLWSFDPLNLRYSVFDRRLDSDSGGIVPNKKGIVLISDTLLSGRLTAVKHANGKDWWIVSHKQSSDVMYIMLLTDTGVSVKSQHLGTYYHEKTELPQFPGQTWKSDELGEACFSPDGGKYAMTGWESELLLMDFDRCNGKFSYEKVIKTPVIDPSMNVPLGCAFSPSSRFLYLNTYGRIFQYDTWKTGFDSADAINIPWIIDSSTTNPMFMEQLAPDGKIYICTWGGDKNFHVIDSPDLAAPFCNVIANGFALPQFDNAIPNFPYFRLHEGNECDTILIPHEELIIYPNPTSGQLTIAWDSLAGSNVILYDMLGREVQSYNIPEMLNGVYGKNNNEAVIDVSKLAAGMYIIEVRKVELRVNKKFIKINE